MRDRDDKKPNIKLFWLFAAALLVIFGLYRFVVMLVLNGSLDYFWLSALMWVYMIAGCGIFVAIFILQRGLSNKPLSAEDLPDSMSITEKRDYLEIDKKRKRTAKYLMIPLIAIIFVFIFEIIDIYYIPAIKSWFSSISS